MPLRYYRTLAIVTPVVVLILLALPGGTVAALLQSIALWLGKEPSFSPQIGYGDKLVHAALFLFCAFFMLRAQFFPQRHWLWLFLLLSAYAGMTELLQTFIPRRVPGLDDFVADLVGIVLGFVWALVLRPTPAIASARS